MGLWRFLTGDSTKNDGFEAADDWIEHGGDIPTSGDNISSIYQEVEQNECPEEFYEGWRSRERAEKYDSFWSWLVHGQ